MMKKIFYFLMVVVMSMPLVACGGDDDSDNSTIVNNLSQVVGTWKCTASTDSWNTPNGSGNGTDLMVNETLTINADGTYSSSSNNFGREGVWTIEGGRFTAENSNGRKMTGSISVQGQVMRINGSTNDGYSFDYTFIRN